MILITDEWSEVNSRELNLQDFTWADVARLIKRLDARKYTLVSLKVDENNHPMVGGGNGRFIVTVTAEGDRFFDLVHAAPTDTSNIRLNVGGQEGEYPADQIVDEDTAVACAMTYLKSSEMDERFAWRES
jgi:hypothetical protein